MNHDRLRDASKDLDLSESPSQVSPSAAKSVEPRLFNGGFMHVSGCWSESLESLFCEISCNLNDCSGSDADNEMWAMLV